MPSEQQTQQTVDVAAIAKAAADEALAPYKDLIDQAKKNKTSVLGGPPPGEERSPITGTEVADGKGVSISRMAACLYRAKTARSGENRDPAAIARALGYTRVEKALVQGEKMAREFEQVVRTNDIASQGTFESLGVMVPRDMASEMFELLRPKVFVRGRARSVPLIAGLDFLKQASSGQAYYKGELDSITESSIPNLGVESMVEKELTSLSIVSNRLLQTASNDAEAFVRDDMVKVKAEKENLAFYRGDGTRGGPKGIRNRALPAHVFASTAAGASATLAEVRADVSRLMLKLRRANAPMQSLAWMFAPETIEFLRQLTDGNGNAVFESAINSGTFMGRPFDDSTQVPNNLGGTTDQVEVGLIDYSEVIIGQGPMFLEVFPNGTYEAGGQTRSGISRNQTVIRLMDYHDLIMRHPESAAFLTPAKWRL